MDYYIHRFFGFERKITLSNRTRNKKLICFSQKKTKQEKSNKHTRCGLFTLLVLRAALNEA
jgi:hypothetical protein